MCSIQELSKSTYVKHLVHRKFLSLKIHVDSMDHTKSIGSAHSRNPAYAKGDENHQGTEHPEIYSGGI